MTREIRYSRQFELVREISKVRDFQLVLCADVFGGAVEYSVFELTQTVEGEKARGGLDYLRCEPLIISERRAPRSRHLDRHTGGLSGTLHHIDASAL